jgi:hypothetical protein
MPLPCGSIQGRAEGGGRRKKEGGRRTKGRREDGNTATREGGKTESGKDGKKGRTEERAEGTIRMKLISILALSLLAGDAPPLAPPLEPPASLILTGGKVWTGDPSRPRAEAVALAGDLILAVGSSTDIARLAGRDTRVVELRGRLVVPGLIDAHVHFLSGGDELLAPDLRSARTVEEFARRVGEAAARMPAGAWVTGGAWDHENWPGAELPRKEILDLFVLRNPVFLRRLDGHMAVANSLAVRIAGIDETTPDPPGGEIVRDPRTGEPTGVLKDAAMELVARHIPPWDDGARRDRARAALRHAASLGVTGVHDMGTTEADLRTFRDLRARGELTLRVAAYPPLESLAELEAKGAPRAAGDAFVKVVGVKAFADGSLGSRTALFLEPYLGGGPGEVGLALADLAPDGALERSVRRALDAGLQPALHAIGDRAIRGVLDVYERLESARGEGTCRALRPRIEHAQHIHPDDLSRFGALGVVASMQPAHAADDGRWAETRIGPERCETTYAFRDLLERGAELAFGSDWPVAPLSPLGGIEAAVTRRTLDGKNPEGWIPRQRISVQEALRAHTSGAARAAFDEGRLGTLCPGLLADLAVLAEDILEIEPVRIGGVPVDLTIVGGKVVFEREEEFRFVVLNDTHVADARCAAFLRKAVAEIQALAREAPVDFALALGDVATDGNEREFELFLEATKDLGIPLHVVPGNHDHRGKDRSAYERAFPGPVNRSFEHKGWRFVGFDSCDGDSWLRVGVAPPVLAWLEAEIAKVPTETPIVAFTHFPLGEGVSWRSTNAEEVLGLFEGRRLVHVFSGHYHGLTERRWRQATLSTCRALSVSRDNHDGSPQKGFLLATARGGTIGYRFVEVKP